jgi:hypothetical protein
MPTAIARGRESISTRRAAEGRGEAEKRAARRVGQAQRYPPCAMCSAEPARGGGQGIGCGHPKLPTAATTPPHPSKPMDTTARSCILKSPTGHGARRCDKPKTGHVQKMRSRQACSAAFLLLVVVGARNEAHDVQSSRRNRSLAEHLIENI